MDQSRIRVLFLLGLLLLLVPSAVRPRAAAACELLPFGVASGFHGFTLGNFSGARDSAGNLLPGSDVQGRLAVGGNFSVKHYGVGDQLPVAWRTGDVLIVGGSIAFDGGRVYGNAVYGTSATWGPNYVTVDGAARQDRPLDFTLAREELLARSAELDRRTTTGSTQIQDWGANVAITFSGSDPSFNVFRVAAATLARAQSITFSVPATSTVLVNISGATVSLTSAGFQLNGQSPTRIIYNLYEATSFTGVSVGIQGSLLAPRATINLTGNIYGQVIAQAYVGTGELDLPVFAGCLPAGGQPPAGGGIGDTVWLDGNNNGQQEGGEQGLPDQYVTLYLDDGDGVFDRCKDYVIDNQLTDAQGNYLFSALAAGPYWVLVEPGTRRATNANPHFVQLAANQQYLAADVGLNIVPTPTNTPPPGGGLKVQYRAGDTNTTDAQIKPQFNILNGTSAAVGLTELKARYWYTIDGEKAQQFWCDYALLGCEKITGSFVKLATARTGADYYLELGFTTAAGSVAQSGQTGAVQTRFNKSDWSPCTETNDYSFDASKTTFVDWTKMTLYRNGALVWGTEP